MFLRCSGELTNACAMESHVGPTPTFSPSVCQLDGARFEMLVLWKMWPALAMVPDQVRAIPTRSPLPLSGGTPAEDRAELIAETKHDSSPASAAEAGTTLQSATTPIVQADMRLQTVREYFTSGLLRRSGCLPRRGREAHDFASPGHPGFAFVERPWDQDPRSALAS